jgi:protein-tyrosine phosphatase
MHSKSPPLVLFVCTANVCRSPMAAGIFKAQLVKRFEDKIKIRVDSAGTWAYPGQPADSWVQEVLLRKGINLQDHRSKTISKKLVYQSKLIITMEPGHKEALQLEFPYAASRIFLLSEFDEKVVPINDPTGGDIEEYENTAREIEKIISRGMSKILTLVNDVKQKP